MIGDKIREWDSRVEEDGAPDEDARKPFDAGIMLAVAKVLDRWEMTCACGHDPVPGYHRPHCPLRGAKRPGFDLAEVMQQLQETAEAVIEQEGAGDTLTYEV